MRTHKEKFTRFKVCATCSELFYRGRTETVQSFLKRRVNCSKECYAKYQKGKPLTEERKALLRGRVAHNKGIDVTLVCRECETHFTVPEWRARQKPQFCTHACASQFKDTGARTADKKARQTQEYKAWRTLVFRRDDYTCVHCGERGGQLHADHIKTFALFPELRFEITNGRTLCVPCHIKTDTYGGRSRKKTLWANAV